MSTLKIEKARWTEYFDHLSNVTDSQLIKIEVINMEIGDQTEVENTPFNGISYDEIDDIISVQAGSVGHMVNQPTQVYVLEGDEGLESMEITDAEGTKNILSFKSA
jgi:hypothetical protein